MVAILLTPMPLSAPVGAGKVPFPSRGGSVITDLGQPVLKTQALSSAIGTGPDGVPQAYLLLEGNPMTTAEFAVVDLRTKKTVLDQRVPGGTTSRRAMDISPADGSVYFGMADTGDLYRYGPSGAGVEHLGTAPPGQQLWSLAVGGDGTLWGGTYPGGRLFSLDPATSQMKDYGQAVPGETYVNAIAQSGNDLYVGTEPNAKLTRLDLSTGTFTPVPPPAGLTGSNIDTLNVRGGLLFVTAGCTLHVRDLATNAWVARIADVGRRGVSPVDPAPPTS